MGPSAFGQFEGADFENRCYTWNLGGHQPLVVFLVSFSCISWKRSRMNFKVEIGGFLK